MKRSHLDWASALDLASMALHNTARLWGSGTVAVLLREMADRAALRAKRLRDRAAGKPRDPQEDIITSEVPIGDDDTERVTQVYGDKPPKP